MLWLYVFIMGWNLYRFGCDMNILYYSSLVLNIKILFY